MSKKPEYRVYWVKDGTRHSEPFPFEYRAGEREAACAKAEAFADEKEAEGATGVGVELSEPSPHHDRFDTWTIRPADRPGRCLGASGHGASGVKRKGEAMNANEARAAVEALEARRQELIRQPITEARSAEYRDVLDQLDRAREALYVATTTLAQRRWMAGERAEEARRQADHERLRGKYTDLALPSRPTSVAIRSPRSPARPGRTERRKGSICPTKQSTSS